MANLGRIAPRECERVFSRHCEERSDEAIHSSLRGGMDCFAGARNDGRERRARGEIAKRLL